MPPRLQGALLAAAVVALTGFSPGRGTTARPGSADPTGGGRRPQAIAVVSLANAGEAVVVGHRVGTVSVLRAADRVLLGEAAVGGNITSLVPLPSKPDAPARLVAVDRDRDQLLILRLTLPAEGPVVPFPAARTRPVVEVEGTFPTCRDPMRAIARDGVVAVSCLWPREARRYDLIVRADGRAALAPGWTTSLPFEARELLRLDDRHLLVADAFGGGLAVLDLGSGAILRSLELTAHNLRGLALVSGGDRVAIVHQELHSGMHTSSDDIRWGVFLTNSVRLLPVDDLVAGNPRMHRRAGLLDLGTVSSPSGDPAAILATPDGQLVVALSGVGRLAFGADDARQVSQMRVGPGPSALALGGGGELFVANTWSDSVSVVSVADRTETARVPLGPPARLTAVDRGELLFHDATLSLRGWMSCNSCHTDGHTNHRLSDTLGDGTYGAPKRVLSLLGVRDTGPWAWDGRIRELEQQVVKSVETTLRGRDLSPREVEDLTAYLRTLDLPDRGPGSENPGLVARGREAFSTYTCDRCHAEPLFTTPGVHDVGLTDERGSTRFNPPSLRDVRSRRRLLHDGSARSLEEVLRIHPGHGIVVPDAEVPALIAFLRTL